MLTLFKKTIGSLIVLTLVADQGFAALSESITPAISHPIFSQQALSPRVADMVNSPLGSQPMRRIFLLAVLGALAARPLRATGPDENTDATIQINALKSTQEALAFLQHDRWARAQANQPEMVAFLQRIIDKSAIRIISDTHMSIRITDSSDPIVEISREMVPAQRPAQQVADFIYAASVSTSLALARRREIAAWNAQWHAHGRLAATNHTEQFQRALAMLAWNELDAEYWIAHLFLSIATDHHKKLIDYLKAEADASGDNVRQARLYRNLSDVLHKEKARKAQLELKDDDFLYARVLQFAGRYDRTLLFQLSGAHPPKGHDFDRVALMLPELQSWLALWINNPKFRTPRQSTSPQEAALGAAA